MEKHLFGRGTTLAALALMITAFAGLSAQPAAAAPVFFVIDDVTYSADDADVNAGASITSYAGVGGVLVLPTTVVYGPDTYAVTSIGADAFKEKSITAVTLPDSLTSIGPAAFQNNSLDTVSIPSGVTSIGAYAFFLNGMGTVSLPATLVSIGNNAFGQNALTTVSIPSLVTQINAFAFQYNQLASVIIPNAVTSIQTGAFRGNQLTSVTVPSAVSIIGDIAFAENPSLASVVMDGDAPTATDAGVNGSFGSGVGLTVRYRAEFADAYTSPWHGYNTEAIAQPSGNNTEAIAQPSGNNTLATTGVDLSSGLVGSGVLVALGVAIMLSRKYRRQRQ
jgi:hypothetical protein